MDNSHSILSILVKIGVVRRTVGRPLMPMLKASAQLKCSVLFIKSNLV